MWGHQEVARGPITKAFVLSLLRAGEGKALGGCLSKGASLQSLESLPLTLRVMLDTFSFRETKGKMEWLGLQGPLDPLGPGALLATLGKMAPGDHQAQR